METHFSVTYDAYQADKNGDQKCIFNRMDTINNVEFYCKMHSEKIGKIFNNTRHHYLITEWDEDDNILNQMNLEEALYEKSKSNN